MKMRPEREVSRRQLLQMGLATTAATLVPAGVESLFPPQSLAQGQDPLPSWNDGAAKQAVGEILGRCGFATIDLGSLAIGSRLQQFPGGPLPTLNLVKLG